ncbi:MAG: methionyl-tRNA formyltransferase [Candidatus Caenarcaniphilales bacterium]|nr:methionyl-tRNA formyltransferase [Candidatus Caenarcaniphilales bacterium]
MKNSDLKIVFLGTPDFAVLPLKKLIENGFKIPLVVTQPDRPSGRGHKTIECPVKKLALEKNLTIKQPEKISKDQEALELLKEIKPDLMITAAFGQILSQEIIDIPKWGIWNIHASLLPRWRGAAPIQWALLEGDKETGITIMMTEKGLDTGPILTKRSIPILEEDNAETLLVKLSEVGADLLLETIELKKQAKLTPQNQDDSLATYASKITKEMGQIKFSEIKDPEELIRKEKALSPWPGLSVYESTTGQALKIFEVGLSPPAPDSRSLPSPNWRGAGGEALYSDNQSGKIFLELKNGSISIGAVQPPNKSKMRAADWLRGLKVKPEDLRFE